MPSVSNLSRRLFLQAVGATPLVANQAKGQSSSEELYVKKSQDELRLGNANIELTLRQDNGGIKQIRGKKHDISLRKKSDIPALSWGLRFYHPDYQNLMTASYMAVMPTINVSEESTRVSATLQWENPPLKAPPHGRLGEQFNGIVNVQVSIKADESLTRWKLWVSNDGDRAIRQTICPQITNIEPIGENGADALYVPSRLGRKYDNPAEQEHLPVHRYPSGFGTMQFVSYLANGKGVYASAEDPEGYAKRLEFVSNEGLLGYRGTHLVPYNPGGDVNVPYEMTFGTHSGTWRDAADRYRQWVESEGWLADVDPIMTDRLRDRGVSYHEMSYSRPASNIGESLSFDTMQEMVLNVQDRLDVPIGFRWWGWEEHGWPGNGDWFPPYEGMEKFEKIIQNFQSKDIDPLGFLNPTLILPSSDYWNTLANPDEIPITSRNGEFSKFSEDNGLTFYYISPLESTWRNHYLGALDQMVKTGYQQLELDGFPWNWVPNCWNEEHTHPLGKGGNWFPKRMRQLLKELHRTHEIPGGLNLGGEGIADFFLPYMNVHIIRDGMAEFDDEAVKRGDAEVVPMFPYTFGDYATTRSQKGHIGTYVEQRNIQRLIAGRSVEWGAIPMFMGHIEPGPGDYDEALLDYYSSIGKARTGFANRFLARGEMLRKPNIQTQTVEIIQRGVETSTPDIRGHGWRGPKGDIGIVVTSVAKRGDSREVSLDFGEQPFTLPDDPLIYIVRNGLYHSIEDQSFTFEIRPSDVLLIAATESLPESEESLARIEDAQSIEDVEGKLLLEAKRAFDRHEYKQATKTASEAIQTGNSNTSETTPTETQHSSTEDANESPATDTQATTSNSATQTETTSPGLGFGSVIGGMAGGLGLKKWFRKDSDEQPD